MLVPGVLGDAAEEGERQGPLDVVVPVDGGRDAGDQTLPDPLVLGQRVDRLQVVLRHRLRGGLLVVLDHVVGDDDGGEDGEAVLGVEAGVVAVAVDAGQLDLFPRPAGVAQVAEEKRVLGPRQPAGRHLQIILYLPVFAAVFVCIYLPSAGAPRAP